MATPVRVRINCKTPSTGISTPSLKVNSPFPRLVQSTRVATLPVNDDVAEKKRRRLEAAASVASPTIGTPVKRKDTDSGNQWTNAQIAEHYSQCIKLSSENKINAKNAFGLHLIDHMAQMLRSKGNMTNFQVAGCTLDAGAKIYAGRVDAIYNDVFKMLGGFGRANKPEKGKESDDEEQPEGEPKRVRGKKHHTNGFSSQIVKDVTTINTNNYDLEFEVDPLFKKMSAAFDEGGAAGLLINQLRLDSDHCQLMMDASSKIIDDVAPIPSIPINVSSLKKYIVDMATAKICPTLAGFSLSSDGQQDEWNTSALLSSTKKPPTSTHFTADGEPLQLNYSSDDSDDGFANIGSAPEHFNDEFPVMNDHTDVFSDNFTATNTHSHQPLATEQQPATRPELLEWSEYSYFSQAAVEAWAGPQHWKLRSRLKPQDSNEENIAEKPTTKRQPRKAFSIDFSVPLADVFVKVKITSRKLSKVQIKKTKVTDTTLPHNECISEKRFLQLFTRPECIVKRRERRNDVEDEVDAEPLYNYDNVVDQENYCPMITETGEGGNSDDDDDDRNTVENYSGNDTALMPFVNNTQQIMLNDTCDVSTRMLNLVAAPNKIEQIKVNFARQAKRINMQKLKSSMWNIITEKQPSRTSEDQENTYAVKQTEVLFSQLYVKLPSLLSQAMAKEVSIPIAFVSLLHLANEKEIMACLWKLCKPKKTEYVPFCPHDIEGIPLDPLLTPSTRKRIFLSWCRIQDSGLMFVGNTIFKQLNLTGDSLTVHMSKDKLEKISDCFSPLLTEHDDNTKSKSLQDKCYDVTKGIDQLVKLVACASCMEEKVNELNTNDGVNKEDYDMLKSATFWILEIILDEGFYPPMRIAWDDFFGCLKDMIEDS